MLDVTKIVPADMPLMFEWLIPNLKDAWPELSENGVVHWLKAASSDRMCYFFKCKETVGLFYAFNDVLDIRPEVVEKFVRSKDADRESICTLYAHAAMWAKDINARSFTFNNDAGNSPMVQWVVPFVEKTLGVRVKKHSVYIAPLTRL